MTKTLNLSKLRQKLHELAELSGSEKETSHYIAAILRSFSPDDIWTDIAGHGVLARFIFKNPGRKILLRADLDALAIPETLSLPYSAVTPGMSHKCGHDGHMAMVLSVLNHLKDFQKGELYLLFQPSEETGEGAKKCLESEAFKNLNFDYVFSLHNLPGYPKGKVVLCEEVFCCSSMGLKVSLVGKSSHAAEPEKALSPYPLMHEIQQMCQSMCRPEKGSTFSLATVTHMHLGEKSFGITPGEGELYITLRSWKQDRIREMKNKIEAKLKENEGIKFVLEEHDDFPSVTVNKDLVEDMKRVFEEKGIPYQVNDFPFRWSEDFGHFTAKYKGAYFGIGSGEDCFPLHHPHYDFPDDVISAGEEVYKTLLHAYLPD